MGANDHAQRAKRTVKIRVEPLDFDTHDEHRALPASALAEVRSNEVDALDSDQTAIAAIRRHWSGQASRLFWLQRAKEHVPASLVRALIVEAHAALVAQCDDAREQIGAALPENIRPYLAQLIDDQLAERLRVDLEKALSVAPQDTSGKTGVLYGGMVAGSGKGATTAEADGAKSNSTRGKHQAKARRA